MPLYHNDGGRCGVRFGLFIIRSKNNNIVKLKTKNNIFVMCSGLAQCCNHAATAVKLAIAVACQYLIGHFTTSSLTPIVQQHRKIVGLHTNQPYTFAVLIFSFLKISLFSAPIINCCLTNFNTITNFLYCGF